MPLPVTISVGARVSVHNPSLQLHAVSAEVAEAVSRSLGPKHSLEWAKSPVSVATKGNVVAFVNDVVVVNRDNAAGLSVFPVAAIHALTFAGQHVRVTPNKQEIFRNWRIGAAQAFQDHRLSEPVEGMEGEIIETRDHRTYIGQYGILVRVAAQGSGAAVFCVLHGSEVTEQRAPKRPRDQEAAAASSTPNAPPPQPTASRQQAPAPVAPVAPVNAPPPPQQGPYIARGYGAKLFNDQQQRDPAHYGKVLQTMVEIPKSAIWGSRVVDTPDMAFEYA